MSALALLVLQTPQPAQAQSASVGYLQRAQNADGGWGGAPGQRSSPLVSGWAALGLAAAGHRSPSALVYVSSHPGDDTGALERTMLVHATAGKVPANLTRQLASRQSRSGAFEGRVNTTSFAILALRAAGRSRHNRAVRRAAKWVARQRNADGGFNFAGRGAPSGIDDTAAALQALVAAGLKTTKAARGAVSYLDASPERRRRLPGPAGRRLERPVDRVGDPGPAGRRPRPCDAEAERRPRPVRLPALADRAQRRGPLLAHERPDARYG